MNGAARRDFAHLALPLLDALYRTARRLTESDADAQDLVQQTYLEAFRCFERLRDRTRCRAWMHQILRNLWLEGLKQRQKRPRLMLLDDLDGHTEMLWPPGTPEDLALQNGFSDEVERGLRSLREEFRTAVVLVDIEGLSYTEVALILGCPKGTVRSRLARGRALLASQLSLIGQAKTKEGGA